MKRKNKKKERMKPSRPPDKQREAAASSLMEEMDGAEPEDIAGRMPDAETAAAFIDILPLKDETSLPVLAAIKEAFHDKRVRKAVKRALFKLNNKGISTDGFFKEDKSPPILRALPKEKPRCLLGPIDGLGYRSFALVLKRNPRESEVALGVVSDENGIEQMMVGPASKKRAMQLIDEFVQTSGPMVETSLDHVATILEQAHGRHGESETEASEAYLELRPWLLENVTLLNRAAVLEYLPESSLKEQTLTNGEIDHLLEQEVMFTWVVDYETLKPFLEEIAAIEKSPIVLTEMQKASRVTEIKEKCSRLAFPPEKSGILKQRLEEMAYFFLKRHDEKNARICLQSSMSLEERDSLFGKSLFIERLVEFSMAVFEDAQVKALAEEDLKEEGESAHIWTP